MPTATIKYRAQHLQPAIAERTAPKVTLSSTAKRDLERYYTVMTDELARLRLTESEWALVREACGATTTVTTYRHLWAAVSDALQDGALARKWGVAGDALVARLRALGPGAAMAVVDAVEREDARGERS